MPALRHAVELSDRGTPGRFGIDLDPEWTATVDLSVHVLAAPAAGPLRLRRAARATAGHLVSMTCDLWDAEGRHVATGHQLCTLRI
jgi:hypothetical protein